jgi:hypothetical protein
VKRQALRALGANTRQLLQLLHQAKKGVWKGHETR